MLTLGQAPFALALSMDAMRYVFTGDKEAISVTVSNDADKTFGGQAWVDNIVEQDTRPTFVGTPSFFKVPPKGKQVMRIIKATDLPQDKESVYWLNLQDIPPAQEGSGLAVAMRTRVKLFYRPAGLIKSRKNAEQQIALRQGPDGLLMKNVTPYIFAIGGVMDANGKALVLPDVEAAKLLMFMPGDEVTVPAGTAQVNAVDDYGDLRVHIIQQAGAAAEGAVNPTQPPEGDDSASKGDAAEPAL
ncbi:fimbria/pilus periplasmic chaperone [Chromobacterium violaceum]|uniref:fimbria/pilus periplasmic chaperone n=1 Tax=Chromobacterium violaceum TaxID=536 RepID=UPI0024A69101|nr:fimbria/pilus periplasmic chaperone [Chromobacterium violaceum]